MGQELRTLFVPLAPCPAPLFGLLTLTTSASVVLKQQTQVSIFRLAAFQIMHAFDDLSLLGVLKVNTKIQAS